MKMEERFWNRVMPEPNTGCWLYLAPSCYRYPPIKYSNSRKSELVHRFSWKLRYGDIPDGLHVLHKCDVSICVNPDHLFLGTEAENKRDMVLKGRSAKGARHGGTKLTDTDAQRIRELYLSGRSSPEIAKQYGIHYTTAWLIGAGRTWRHLL